MRRNTICEARERDYVRALMADTPNEGITGYAAAREVAAWADLAAVEEKLLAARIEMGYITSAVGSPRLGAVALGYVRRGHEQPGTRVVVAGQAAEISGLPFES